MKTRPAVGTSRSDEETGDQRQRQDTLDETARLLGIETSVFSQPDIVCRPDRSEGHEQQAHHEPREVKDGRSARDSLHPAGTPR